MFTEAIFSPASPDRSSRPEVIPNSEKSALGIFANGWMQSLSRGTRETFSTVLEKMKQPSEIVGWTSARYFDAGTLSRSTETQKLITQQLEADLESFYDEFAFLRRSVTYEYGPNGIRNGYSESMSEIARNFIDKLKGDNRPTERSELELQVALYVEAWMRNGNVQVGEKIVFVSPRGSKEEWYPGLDERNLVFVNIFEKTKDGFELHEFRNYDPNNQLGVLQDRITQDGQGTSQKISRLYPEYAAQSVIANVIHLPSSTSKQRVEKQIFLNKKKWRMDIDTDLPHLPESEMQAKLKEILHFCSENFEQLSQTAHALEEKIIAFDLLVTLVLKDLKKWVENAATNYDASKQQDHVFDLEKVKKVWLAECKEKRGEKLETSEKAIVSEFKMITALNPSLPFGKAASFVHCMVGSPAGLLQNINAAGGLTGNVIGNVGFDARKLENMNPSEQAQLLHQLKNFKPITVHGETWYVPEEYLKFKKCYFDHATGKVMGPCDIPLENDPEVLTKKAYLALMEELHKPENLPSLLGLATAEREKALELYKQLKNKLFLSSASFEKIMLNDFIDNHVALPPLLEDLRSEIAGSLNPLLELMNYLVETIKKKENVVLQEISHAIEETSGRTFIFPRSRTKLLAA